MAPMRINFITKNELELVLARKEHLEKMIGGTVANRLIYLRGLRAMKEDLEKEEK